MKTSIKKILTSLLLATLWTVIVALLNLVKIGGGSITYFFAMAVFGYTSGCVVVKLTNKIFEKLEKRKAALTKKKNLPVVSKEYHCKNCGENFKYNNPTGTPKYCSYCGGELAETTEAGKILSQLFYSVEHEKAEEYPIKSEKLCSECKYCWGNRGCDIDRWFSDEMNRRCLTIKNGDPCPYFKKFEPKEGAEK